MEIAGQLLSGLEAAHAAGIIHRDIKPENVIQRHDGVVKILDFGIAKLLEKPAPENPSTPSPVVRTETGVGVMLGTIGYMSPEQVRGLPVDVRTDIWSCGVVLYEMLGGQRPFDGQTNADTLVTMLEREPEPLFGTGAQTPGALRQIQVVIDKALCKEPAERYQTAAEMRTMLEKIKTELEANKQSASDHCADKCKRPSKSRRANKRGPVSQGDRDDDRRAANHHHVRGGFPVSASKSAHAREHFNCECGAQTLSANDAKLKNSLSLRRRNNVSQT